MSAKMYAYKCYGMRVVNVYDVDNKTYLIKLGRPEEKAVILIESGIRIHCTEFDWPKNMAPSGFSMKLRKHIKGRRLESITQLGVDRIVNLQFGSGEAAYHVILELYDRGNVVLTDYEFTILNILRPRTDQSQDVRFAVREKYPITSTKTHEVPTDEKLMGLLSAAKEGDSLKKVLVSHLDYGPAIIDHSLMIAGVPEYAKIGKHFSIKDDLQKLRIAVEEAEMLFALLQSEPCKGVIVQKREKRVTVKDGDSQELLTYEEFHPMVFKQFEHKTMCELVTFNKAVDEFFSQLESQKLDMKSLQQEKSALKKLDNIKKDHEKRIDSLQKVQETDISKGQLIEMNLELIDKAITIVRSAIANQIDWTEINNLVKEAQTQGDPVAKAIKGLKLDSNHITMLLRDPYADSDEEDDECLSPQKVDVDLSVSAYANSRRFFDKKKQAAKKEQKTIDASAKALKSAEKKTKETLKEVATAASINKTRKTYWFEKFLWFITSENFLVIGGRDQQQNEMIVKRYLKPGDLYVHADLHGASSCVIKNSTGNPVPPKSLNEAGSMAICNSAAWDAKVVTSAWWVYHDQVSKTAPSGEYLTTGSFMVRGKKNYLPPSFLVYGFGFVFKLEDDSIIRHKGERKIRTTEEDEMSIITESDMATDTASMADVSDDDSSDQDDTSQTGEEGQQQGLDTLEEQEEETQEQGMQIVEVKVEGVKEKVKEEVEEEKEEESSMFPDTEISLQHIKGDKYELQRGRSNTSDSVETVEICVEKEKKPVVPTVVRLSAKQRRDLKKAKKAAQQPQEDEEDSVSWLSQGQQGQKGGQGHQQQLDQQKQQLDQQKQQQKAIEERLSVNKEEHNDSDDSKLHQPENKQIQEQQTQAKRGQKGKLKKMKERYADQDEEERQQKMDILASAGSKKEDKKKKGKKGKGGESDQSRPQSAKQQLQQQKKKGLPRGVDVILQPTANLIVEDATGITEDKKADQEIEGVPGNSREDKIDDKGEDETTHVADDLQMLDSLTGIPVTEDELLYAIPVCAPYNCLVNYKYKVKLTPGSTKRGKASKTALNMFLHDKAATSREKDLMRILKDIDQSRNIPGKVKVSAPNLHRNKKKK
ncbi:nuclear export mediator factor Nemf-like isoform X2 [Mizuhopecten yessoensis]|uniref:nuclear export mediator factor Nemf-like isoform X2 n=1 Tax=Mizuhopecten yessoensis TaxID=6573 RepID=UPI000B458BFE|nr:nuclear export mediator factor Nemf-like isoform X2 [Mizuhopecten yessoensis]